MKTPQVLLLGNGLNLAFGGTSWNNLIADIRIRDDINIERLRKNNVPMPLQAILVTNNNIKDAMRKQAEAFKGKVDNPEHRKILREILDIGFTDILTTNYSYEIEIAASDKEVLSDGALKKISKSTQGRVEPKYLIHTYNEVSLDEAVNRVWHIHGESRKPDSMILGHYWYANLLGKIKAEIDASENGYQVRQMKNEEQLLDSWLDSFILGDVYVLGFGMNLSEFDLWWLINRKKREKAETGKIYYYEMQDDAEYEKIELLKLFGVEVIDFGMSKPAPGNESDIYKDYYKKAISEISKKVISKGV